MLRDRDRDLASLFRASALDNGGEAIETERDRADREHAEQDNVLYEQEIGVTIISAERDRDDRSASLIVRVALQSESTRKMQSMHIDLVDPKNPLFLYTLKVSEAEFHVLKQRQDLLVDFVSFPEHLVRLLELCVSCASDPSPKYVSRLTLHPSASRGVLSVLETSRLRHLQHLELEFRAASDLDLKDYLSHQVKMYKAHTRELRSDLDESRATVGRLQHEMVELRTKNDKMLSDTDAYKHELSVELSSKLSREKEQSLLAQRSVEARADEERRSLLSEHRTETSRLQTKIDELQTQNRELSEQLMNLRHSEQRTTQRLQTTTAEIEQNVVELKALRSENHTLASKAHGQEKELNKINMELIALKQQLVDRDDVNTKTASLLDASKEHKENLEDSLKLYKANNEKNERRLRECIKEISKGNKIIQQLQSDVRNAKSKLKLKSSVIVQQEGVIQKKQEEINDAERALKAAETELKRKSFELQQRDEEMQRLRDDLNKSKEVIESNQKVISLLNQEVTDQQLRSARQSLGGNGSGSAAYSFPAAAATAQQHQQQPLQPSPLNQQWKSAAYTSAATTPLTSLARGAGAGAEFPLDTSSAAVAAAPYGSHPALASLRASRQRRNQNMNSNPAVSMPTSSFFASPAAN